MEDLELYGIVNKISVISFYGKQVSDDDIKQSGSSALQNETEITVFFFFLTSM